MKYSSDREAFDSYCRDWFDCETEAQLAWLVWQASAVTTRAELASQVQPVAWGMPDANGNIVDVMTDLDKCEGMKKWGEQYSVPLYLHPPTPARHDAPESVVCIRCGHENWIQEGKAQCQVVPNQAQHAAPEDEDLRTGFARLNAPKKWI